MNSQEEITRTILGNVSPALATAFYVAAYAACGWAALVFIRRFLNYRKGRPTPEERESKVTGADRLVDLVRYLAFHRELRRDPRAGLAHLLVFYGFVILFMGTCLVFLEHDTPLHFFYGRFYLVSSFIVDLGGLAFIAGLLMFLVRRRSGASRRILREWWVTSLAVLLLLIGVSGFLLEASRIAHEMPSYEKWSPVGYGTAMLLRLLGMGGPSALGIHRTFWVMHAFFCVAFFALLPWRFFGHMVYGAMSWATRAARPVAELPVLSLQTHPPGAVSWTDFRWPDLLQVDACTTCGRCNEVCPAHAAGKPLRPREIVLGLRRATKVTAGPNGDDGYGLEKGSLSSWISDESIWSCTTCGACNEVCPVGIEVFNKIVDVRRGRVESGTVPGNAETLFENTAADFNPFGKRRDQRMEWAAGIDPAVAARNESIELLYWVGCAGAFDADGRSVAQAMIRILNGLKVSYRILGHRECCSGDPARRMGEEGLFRELADRNIKAFQQHSVRRVLTSCPHCFNTFRNEYPSLGADLEVEHHSVFLARLIAEGQLSLPARLKDRVTFHDPCYLARGNDVISPPRTVVAAVASQTVEMEHHGRSSFCCGAGGGAMWLDIPGQTRVENLRARHAASTGATTIATGCPFCKGMLLAGQQSLEQVPASSMRVKDLAELVIEAKGW